MLNTDHRTISVYTQYITHVAYNYLIKYIQNNDISLIHALI